MPRILIVADDLTGALDSAVAFAARGMPTRVVRDRGSLAAALAAGPAVLALATGTRERDAAAAVETVEAMLAGLTGWADIVFKKIDSRLKGHIVAETAAVARLTGQHGALVAPAIPGFGRIVRRGQLSGHGMVEPIDIAARFHSLPLPCTVPEVTTKADFLPALTAATPGTMLVGARGLAAALAEKLAGPPLPLAHAPARPLLLAIGSRDPITLAQIARLANHPELCHLRAPNGVLPAATASAIVLAQLTPGTMALDSQTVTPHFARGLATLVDTTEPATLFACGGETADSLLAQLGVGGLALAGEILPGMPLATIHLAGRTMTFISKSGGFGTPDALLDLLNAGR